MTDAHCMAVEAQVLRNSGIYKSVIPTLLKVLRSTTKFYQ